MTLTPKQFNKLVTKDDLKGLEKKMDKKFDAAYHMFATKDDIKELKREMATKTDVDKILAAVDGIAKKHQDFEAELAANLGAHDRFEERITKLEKVKA
jgi:hypothetical protein